MNDLGHVVILNGAPRSGKSSIVQVIQETFDDVWMNLGVDVFNGHVTPPRFRPGMGLRPGGERPEIEALMPALYGALYDSVAAHSRLGLNVVVDVGHHDGCSKPLHLLGDCARRLERLPVLFVGVRCPLEVIMERRRGEQQGVALASVSGAPNDTVPDPVLRWQHDVHVPGIYDLEVDTSVLTPAQCAELIRRRLIEAPVPSAFQRLAGQS
jgi:chloramphenicol 3-O phosphotransferase